MRSKRLSPSYRFRNASTVIRPASALRMIAILLIVQIWLLRAALESFLAGNHHTALPAAVFSGVIFLICLGLYLFVHRVDSEVRRYGEEP